MINILTGSQFLDYNIVDADSFDEKQVQPNGFDLRVARVYEYPDWDSSKSRLGFDVRFPPVLDPVKSFISNTEGAIGYWVLEPGAYWIEFVEKVSLPENMMAYLRPRSTLLRNGVTIETAVWDAGYTGYGGCMLVVHAKNGVTLDYNFRVGQLVVHHLGQETFSYNGQYQNEGIEVEEDKVVEETPAPAEETNPEEIEGWAELVEYFKKKVNEEKDYKYPPTYPHWPYYFPPDNWRPYDGYVPPYIPPHIPVRPYQSFWYAVGSDTTNERTMWNS